MDREERERWEREIVSAAYHSSQEAGRRLLDCLDACERQRDSHEAAKIEVAKRLIIAETAVTDNQLALATQLELQTQLYHTAAANVVALTARLDACERERDEARMAVEQTFAVNRALKGTNERLAAEYETMEEDARALAQALDFYTVERWSCSKHDATQVARTALARPGVRRLLEEK